MGHGDRTPGGRTLAAMNRKHLSLGALAVVLVALGIALLPFGWRDPYEARVDCSSPVVAAWDRYPSGTLAPTRRGAGRLAAFPSTMAGPTACAKKARGRLATSGVLLGLTLGGWFVGRRILEPSPAVTAPAA
jgi:hypothetical protein